MSPTRLLTGLLTALLIPAALLVVFRSRLTTYPFEVEINPYDVEPQLHQRSTDRRYAPMPRSLRPKRLALN
ncbi:MAG: hypothetical protein HKN04_12120 [Rhodothermaceae bacterium]|nr:hypothetical protein [Rhodothermaceae bacterium]